MSDFYEGRTIPLKIADMAIISCNKEIEKLQIEIADLKAEAERLRKACELVFDESAKRKFLMCYRGNDFYVSKEAMEAMSVALGYSKAKEGKPSV